MICLRSANGRGREVWIWKTWVAPRPLDRAMKNNLISRGLCRRSSVKKHARGANGRGTYRHPNKGFSGRILLKGKSTLTYCC